MKGKDVSVILYVCEAPHLNESLKDNCMQSID